MDYEEGGLYNGMPPKKRQRRIEANPIDTSLIQCRYVSLEASSVTSSCISK